MYYKPLFECKVNDKLYQVDFPNIRERTIVNITPLDQFSKFLTLSNGKEVFVVNQDSYDESLSIYTALEEIKNDIPLLVENLESHLADGDERD